MVKQIISSKRAAVWQSSYSGETGREQQRLRSHQKRLPFLSVWCLFGPALLLQAPSWAQTAPDAGALQQQIESTPKAPTPRVQTAPKDSAAADSPPLGPTVVVNAFQFTGNTLLGDDALRAVVAPLLGRALDFAQLQSSAVLVADLYRNKGWVVQTYLPEQDVASGAVTIAVVEAVFGTTQVIGTGATHVSPDAVLALFAHQQKTGTFLNMDALDRALLLADDLPGVSVSGSLAPGQSSGQTDMVLQLTDEPWVKSSISIDNTGAVSTGSGRANLALSLNSPSGRGDDLNLNATATQGSRYSRLAYSVPLGSDGWRLALNSSHLSYDLVSEAYQSLKASGSSSTAGLEMRYPLVRSRAFNLSTSLTFDKKDYVNVSGGSTSSAYRNTPVSLNLNANSFDAFGGGGANAYTWAMTAGELNLDGSPTQSSDASSSQTAGQYTKVRYSLSRQQQLDTNVSFFTALSGQWAGKNLDSSEKFYLGGVNGVRAYPSSEAGGSKGQLLNLELRWQLRGGVNLVGFYDFGQVMVNANKDFDGAVALNDYALQGAGLALQWRSSAGLNLQATYARRIGENPNPITTEVNRGADQDGTLHRERLWLTASLEY